MSGVDLSKLTPIEKIQGDDWQETEELRELADQAESFVSQFAWAGNVLQQYAGPSIPGVVGIFLLRIDPAKEEVDEWLWVIVGDIPSAYLVTDGAPDPPSALEVYIELMEEWVDAVSCGQPVNDLIPVNVQPTKENADLLASRLAFLRSRVVPEFRKTS